MYLYAQKEKFICGFVKYFSKTFFQKQTAVLTSTFWYFNLHRKKIFIYKYQNHKGYLLSNCDLVSHYFGKVIFILSLCRVVTKFENFIRPTVRQIYFDMLDYGISICFFLQDPFNFLLIVFVIYSELYRHLVFQKKILM